MKTGRKREILAYSWAYNFLKRKLIPFRKQYDEHYVRMPSIEDITKTDDEFQGLLHSIGWECKCVVAFKTPENKCFFAWLCTPKVKA